MAYEERPGGVLFPKKKVNPNQPDFDGNILIDPNLMEAMTDAWLNKRPIKLEVAGWKKISKKDGVTPYMSLSVKLGREMVQSPPARQAPRPEPDPFSADADADDGIPF